MNRSLHKGVPTLVLVSLIASIAPISLSASEVTGTLSSDGSSGPARTQQMATGTAGGGHTLSGTVVGGSEESGAAMSALAGIAEGGTLLSLLSILIALSLLAGIAGFLAYRRSA